MLSPPAVAGTLARAVFAGAVFSGAALVFLVEPMIAKLVLPLLGGSPAVWNTSLAFFQAALLVGYGYAHLLQRIRSVPRQALVHGAVLIVAALFLPLKVSHALGDPGATPPALWLIGVLTLSIGAPFAALSATAPLVQAWYARLRTDGATAPDPFVLYSASNLGSLLALLAYPALVEPLTRLHDQTLGWSLGYGAFVLLMASVATLAWRWGTPRTETSAPLSPPTSWARRGLWIALAAAPSSLMLGVTTHITTDIASAPFLWVAPLALYLLTFIIAFQAKPLIRPSQALLFQGAVVLLCFYTLSLSVGSVIVQLLIHLAGFFLTALVCHQALAARRPAPDRLTEFYLLMSVGGVIGGAFNAFLAPVIFRSVVEYPAVLILAGLARPWGTGRLTRGQIGLLAAGLAGGVLALLLAPVFDTPQAIGLPVKLMLAMIVVAAFLIRDRAPAFVVLCAVLTFSAQAIGARPHLIRIERGFFGVLKINLIDEPTLGPTRELIHGTTMHGAEAIDPARRCQPLVYYAPAAPIGQVFRGLEARKSALSIGAIGMGVGTVAAYVRPADRLRFFEIDPLVVGVATDPALFGYIHGCAKGPIDWVVGDARLTLAREPRDEYDLLLVDAFSSDSVPAHLLTVEAMRGYLSHIKPDGVVVLHLSNRNLELMSPVAGIARAAGGYALQQNYAASTPVLAVESSEQAVMVARTPAALAPFLSDPRWVPAQSHGVRLWTDDYTNLAGALVRRLAAVSR